MLIGQKIGPFLVEKELGSGAMGTVFLAKFELKDQVIPAALKIVSLGLLGNESALARFEREASILKQLRHPNIVRLYATGRYKQTPFLAMEFVNGESLDRVLARRDRMSWEEVVDYAKQLCEALDHAHEKGIIHRDLKPSNLMVTTEGTLKLTDFGIAKDMDVTALTGANSTIGTAAYMSPEQCRGAKDISSKSDLYSFGVVLYELITGKKPFRAESTVDMFLMHVNETPVRPIKLNPELPVWLDNLIMCMLEKDPDKRPMNAQIIKRMLVEIEEKVQSQQSLGEEVAHARRIDRTHAGKNFDASDREAARSLKSGTRKRRRRRKAVPIFQRTWFKATLISGALLGLVGVGIWLSLPPSLDNAYADFQQAAEFRKLEAAEELLKNHGDREDPRIDEVRQAFIKLKTADFEEKIVNNFHSKLKGKADYEAEPYQASMAALDAETEGNIKLARQLWEKVRDQYEPVEPKALPQEELTARACWRWLAEKRLLDLQAVTAEYKKLQQLVNDMHIEEELKAYPETDPQGQAILAVRYEYYEDAWLALKTWDALTILTKSNVGAVRFHLLACERKYALTARKIVQNESDAERRKKLAAMIDSVERLWERKKADSENRVARRDIRVVCRDIIDLYQDHPDEEIANVVNRARSLQKIVPSTR